MNQKNKNSTIGVGGVTVFMVLAVLIIVIFAVLTLTAALTDHRMAQKYADLTTDFYEADSQSVDLLVKLEAIWPENTPMPAFSVFEQAAMEVMPGVSCTFQQETANSLRVFCVLDRGNSNFFEIDAILLPEGQDRWIIYKWVGQSSITSEEPDELLPVWRG